MMARRWRNSHFVKTKEHKALDFSSYGSAYPLATCNPNGRIKMEKKAAARLVN